MAAAMERHDQCVSPGGFACKVRSTIWSILACGIVALRPPRPDLTCANFVRPSPSNSSRHARTVLTVAPTCAAIVVFAVPSAASSKALARCTCRCGAVRDRASTSSVSR